MALVKASGHGRCGSAGMLQWRACQRDEAQTPVGRINRSDLWISIAHSSASIAEIVRERMNRPEICLVTTLEGSLET